MIDLFTLDLFTLDLFTFDLFTLDLFTFDFFTLDFFTLDLFTLDNFTLDCFLLKQADVTMMKFYNCHNREGFNIDGKMDANEMNFSNEFCPWQMVSGPSGTFLQSLDFEQNFAEGKDKGDILKNWYYDNGTPFGLGHYESPLFLDPYFLDKFENGTFGFHMCSALLDNQVIIWHFNNCLTFCCCYQKNG